MIGDPSGRKDWLGMVWCRAASAEIAAETPGKFTLIKTNAQAVEFFKRLMQVRPLDVSELRGKNLACWCRLDQPCHADVLLEIANGSDESD